MKTVFLCFLAAGFLGPRAAFSAGGVSGEVSGDSLKRSWASQKDPSKAAAQLELLGIVFADELPRSKRERAIRELEKTAGDLVPEAKEALFLVVRRKTSPFSIKLAALEILRKARLSEEKVQMEAVLAAQGKLSDKDSGEERRLTALLYDIISGLPDPSPAVQEDLALLAVAENPIKKSTPKAALTALSRVSYSQSAAKILALGLVSDIPDIMKPMIAKSLLAAGFDAADFDYSEYSVFESGIKDAQAAALRKKTKSRRAKSRQTQPAVLYKEAAQEAGEAGLVLAGTFAPVTAGLAIAVLGGMAGGLLEFAGFSALLFVPHYAVKGREAAQKWAEEARHQREAVCAKAFL